MSADRVENRVASPSAVYSCPMHPEVAQQRPGSCPKCGMAIGHTSMLLYSMLHLTGVKAVNSQYERLGEPSVTLEDIQKFRQLDSKAMSGHK